MLLSTFQNLSPSIGFEFDFDSQEQETLSTFLLIRKEKERKKHESSRVQSFPRSFSVTSCIILLA